MVVLWSEDSPVSVGSSGILLNNVRSYLHRNGNFLFVSGGDKVIVTTTNTIEKHHEIRIVWKVIGNKFTKISLQID